MRIVLVLLALTAVAHADTLDTKHVVAQATACANADDLAALGEIQKVETIGKRLASQVLHLTGKQARGYLIFKHDGCEIVPVAGKPVAFAKGNFGNSATVAFALRGTRCGDLCTSVVSLKSKDDKLLDLLVLPEDCEDNMSLAKRSVFGGRDSLELGCFTSGGADQGRSDLLLDAGSGSLEVMVTVSAGIAWNQVPFEEGKPHCTARVPGGLAIARTGAKPELDVTTAATPEEAEAAKVERFSGGCDATVATRRFVLDASGKAFVAKPGKPRVYTLRKICKCRR